MAEWTVLVWHVALVVLAMVMALSDARSLTVPNTVPAGFAALFVLGALFLFPAERSLTALATGGVVLALGLGLFVLNLLPGGDVKGFAGASLLVAPGDWFMVLTGLWLLTLVAALVMLIGRRGLRGPFPLTTPLGLTLAGYGLGGTLPVWP